MNSNPLKKLRIEFIIVVMSIVIIFLMTIFSVQYLTSRRDMVRSSENALTIAMSELERNNWEYSVSGMNGGRNPGGFEPPEEFEQSENIEKPEDMEKPEIDENQGDVKKTQGQMMDQFADNFTRKSVLIIKVDSTGGVSSVRNDMFYMEDDYIDEMLAATPYSKTEDGVSTVLRDYNMRYMVKRNGEDTYVAYVDESDSHSTLKTMLRNSILISLVVIIAMFFLSLVLSKKVLAPVEKAWDDQKRFVADASHELKTPLAVILSNAEMLEKSKDKNSEKNGRRLNNIRMEAERMRELVQELLEIARGDVQSKELVKEKINLSELIDEELLVWEPVIYEAGKSLESELADDVQVTGDPTKLRRLINILVDNALKYSDDRSVIRVKLSFGKAGGKLSVENEGKPLSKEECTKIFERFYRADASREQTAGYGLGLSIATNIAQEHGFKIYAISNEIDKNTFVVEM